MKLVKTCKRAWLACHQDQAGAIPRYIAICIILLVGIIGILRVVESHAAAASTKISSGITGYCLDDYTNSPAVGAPIDLWSCNDTDAQVWHVSATSIIHDSDRCLSVQNDATTPGTKVVLDTCDEAAGQVWLRERGGYENPNSGLCLAAPANKSDSQLIISPCGSPLSPQEVWIPATLSSGSQACQGTEGEKVACAAETEWAAWQNVAANHESLLNTYTDGAPYEEWCADFVSYVYKQAGYPFTQGEADGWDESNANNIQNMGFIKHSASSGYVPKPGDVAYFNYEGGHVEIVVSGGRTPTFIYGNSATIDPTTGNGQMEANTITNEGDLGQVIYYLSPR